jgi:membrane protease YdiL (CAAX protease family)
MLYVSPPIPVIYLLFLAIPAIALTVFVIFTKMVNSTLERQGYKKPTTLKPSKCLTLSIIFIVIYLFVYLFPGLPTGSFTYTGVSTDPVLIVHRIASAILLGLAAESIFRGYVFRNLLRKYGFFTSLYASSILFGVYQISIKDVMGASAQGLVTYTFINVLPSFAAGLFLGFFFYKTGWSLLGPATFRMGVQYFFDPLPIIAPGFANLVDGAYP